MSWFKKLLGKHEGAPAAATAEDTLFAKSDALNDQAETLMAGDKPAEALTAMEAAIAALRQALAVRPEAEGRLNWFGELYSKLAAIKLKLGDMDGAAMALKSSEAAYRHAPHAGPLPQLTRGFPGAAADGTVAPSAMGRFYIAPPAQPEAVQPAAAAGASGAGEDPFATADTLDKAAGARMGEGKPAEALGAMDAAIASLQKALAGRNDHPARERWLAELYGKQASIKVQLGDLDGAGKSLLDSWVTSKALAARFPAVPDLQADTAIALRKMSGVMTLQGRSEEALRFIEDAAQAMAKLAQENPGKAEYGEYLGVFQSQRANCLKAAGRAA